MTMPTVLLALLLLPLLLKQRLRLRPLLLLSGNPPRGALLGDSPGRFGHFLAEVQGSAASDSPTGCTHEAFRGLAPEQVQGLGV